MKASILAPIAIFLSVAIAGTPDNPENMTPCLVCVRNQRVSVRDSEALNDWMNVA
jgi:hypothetical protein